MSLGGTRLTKHELPDVHRRHARSGMLGYITPLPLSAAEVDALPDAVRTAWQCRRSMAARSHAPGGRSRACSEHESELASPMTAVIYLPLAAPAPTAGLCEALRGGTALLFLRQLRQLEWHDHTSLLPAAITAMVRPTAIDARACAELSCD